MQGVRNSELNLRMMARFLGLFVTPKPEERVFIPSKDFALTSEDFLIAEALCVRNGDYVLGDLHLLETSTGRYWRLSVQEATDIQKELNSSSGYSVFTEVTLQEEEPALLP